MSIINFVTHRKVTSLEKTLSIQDEKLVRAIQDGNDDEADRIRCRQEYVRGLLADLMERKDAT